MDPPAKLIFLKEKQAIIFNQLIKVLQN